MVVFFIALHLCCRLAYHTFPGSSGTGWLLLVYCCLEQCRQVIWRPVVLLKVQTGLWSWTCWSKPLDMCWDCRAFMSVAETDIPLASEGHPSRLTPTLQGQIYCLVPETHIFKENPNGAKVHLSFGSCQAST